MAGTTGGSSSIISNSTLPSPTFRFQRTSSNIGTSTSTTTTSSSNVTTTTTTTPAVPMMKRNHSYLTVLGGGGGATTTGTMGFREDDTKSGLPSAATAVSSLTHTSSSSVSSSLQYYNNLIQHQMYTIRRGRTLKKRLKHHSNSSHESSIWTVQIPKRILFGTMGIFLLIPVLLFVYKELHLPNAKELRGTPNEDSSSRDGTYVIQKSNTRNQEYVTWMANFLATNEEVEDDEDAEDEDGDQVPLLLTPPTTSSSAVVDINETIHNDSNNESINQMDGDLEENNNNGIRT